MEPLNIKQQISALLPDAEYSDGKQFPEILIPEPLFHEYCSKLKSDDNLKFDYLISVTAIDWNDHFMVVCHLTSTSCRHTLVVKTKTDRLNPEVDSLFDIWKTAEYHEREVYDLFGIKFRNHPDLRRLFLEDDYAFPLRKDFADENRVIVR